MRLLFIMWEYVKFHFLLFFMALGNRGKKFKVKMKEDLLKIKSALANEGRETKYMLETYMNFSLGRASKKDMERANAQFQDLLKGAGLGIFAALPFAPITIPLIVKLGRKFGVEVLPSAFLKNKEGKEKGKDGKEGTEQKETPS